MRGLALSSLALSALLGASGCSLLFETAGANSDAGPDDGDGGQGGGDAGPPQSSPKIWAGPNASHTCISRGPKLLCWGVNHSGQLGTGFLDYVGDDEAADILEVQADFGANIRSVSMSENHTCAVTAAAELYCWGSAQGGILGYGDESNVLSMLSEAGNVPIGTGIRRVATSEQNTCVIRERAMICYGETDTNILCGLHDNTCPAENLGDDEVPELIADAPLSDPILELAMGTEHACAVLENEHIDCWGTNEFGELGVSATPAGPPSHQGPHENTKDGLHSLALGRGFGCGLDRNGDVRCWGRGSSGQLGEGNTENVESLGAATRLDFDYQVDKVVAGDEHACVLSRNQEQVQCWGQGVYGALGRESPESIGDDENVRNRAPIKIPGVVDIAAGRDHTCVAIDNGEFDITEVVCWGLNTGQSENDVGVLGRGIPCKDFGANGKCIYGDESGESIEAAPRLRFKI